MRSGYINALDVHELLDAVARKLAPEAALLYAAERQPSIGPYDLIDKDGTALDAFACNALTAFAIAGEDSAAKAENGIVGNRDRRLFVLHGDHGRDRPEQLFVIGGHALLDIGQHRRRIIRTATVGYVAAQQTACAHRNASLDLVMQCIA